MSRKSLSQGVDDSDESCELEGSDEEPAPIVPMRSSSSQASKSRDAEELEGSASPDRRRAHKSVKVQQLAAEPPEHAPLGGCSRISSSTGDDRVVDSDGDEGDVGAGVGLLDEPECSTSSSRRRASSLATFARSISVREICFLSWYWHSPSRLPLTHCPHTGRWPSHRCGPTKRQDTNKHVEWTSTCHFAFPAAQASLPALKGVCRLHGEQDYRADAEMGYRVGAGLDVRAEGGIRASGGALRRSTNSERGFGQCREIRTRWAA